MALDLFDSEQMQEVLAMKHTIGRVRKELPVMLLPLAADPLRLRGEEAHERLNFAHQAGFDCSLAGPPVGSALVLQVGACIARRKKLQAWLDSAKQGHLDEVSCFSDCQTYIQKNLWEFCARRCFHAIPALNPDLKVILGGAACGPVAGQVADHVLGEQLAEGLYEVQRAARRVVRRTSHPSGAPAARAPERAPGTAVSAGLSTPGTTRTAGISAATAARLGAPTMLMRVVPKAEVRNFADLRRLNRSLAALGMLSAAAWSHPHVASLRSVLHGKDHICMLTEHSGASTSLHQLLDPMSKWPLCAMGRREALHQVARIVAHLHGIPRICHGDVRPACFWVRGSGRGLFVILADFTFASIQEDPVTLCRGLTGTWPYMAPEVLLAQAYDGFAADLWSLGATLLEILCGVGTMQHLVGGTEAQVATMTAGEEGDEAVREAGYELGLRLQRPFRCPGSAALLAAAHARPEAQTLMPVAGPLLEGLLKLGPRRRPNVLDVARALERA